MDEALADHVRAAAHGDVLVPSRVFAGTTAPDATKSPSLLFVHHTSAAK